MQNIEEKKEHLILNKIYDTAQQRLEKELSIEHIISSIRELK